jgi:hypothetical protein
MNRRHIGRTLVVALIGLTLVALPVAGLAAVGESPSDASSQGPVTTNETLDDDMNDSDDMDTTEEMNDEEMETTEQMNDGDDMDEDESEGGSLDGFGIVAVVLAAVAILGYTRLR